MKSEPRRQTLSGEEADVYLQPTWFLDSDSQGTRQFAGRAVGDVKSETERAVRLYYAVRDGIWYSPYALTLDQAGYKASSVAAAGQGFCIQKAILLVASARFVGIPGRLGFADVRNHLATEKLLARMATDVFVFHGYAELWLEGGWIKATPVFNKGLCERFGVPTLEFDGRSDAIFHPFDAQGRRHMEYLRDRGSYADFPFDEMVRAFEEFYPHLLQTETAPDRDDIFEAPR
jgi:transglutaminase-like putative cysteine protease